MTSQTQQAPDLEELVYSAEFNQSQRQGYVTGYYWGLICGACSTGLLAALLIAGWQAWASAA